MLSRTLRQRIGGLLREGFLGGYLPGLEPRRHFVSTGIEEILPGGLVETEHGPVFAHERLYTDLGERPVPLLRRLADLRVYPGCELDEPDSSNGSGPRY